MLSDTCAALYQRGVVPLPAAEVWTGIWMIVTVFIAVKLYRQMKSPSARL